MWREKRLDELADIVSGGTPSREISAYWGGDIPWVTPTDVTACNSNYLYQTDEYITAEGLRNSSAKLLPRGAVLFTSRATVGETRIAALPVCTNQGFKSLVAKPGIDNRFLFYSVSLNAGSFRRYAVGSTFPEINKKDTARVKLVIPDSTIEQEKIADILETADEAIEKTEALIAKYEQIKQGLMQDLFTRGVDEKGQLRLSYEEAPHLYKETELGLAPREWDIEIICDILNAVIDYRGKPPPKSEHGVPLITARNVRFGFIDPEPQEFIPLEKFDGWMQRGIPNPGDVIFTTEAPLGYVAQIPNYRIALGQRTITLQPKRTRIQQDFLKWLLMSEGAQRRILEKQSGSTATGIQQKTFLKLKFLIPPLREQDQICHTLNCIQRKIDAEAAESSKLQEEKAGLLQDMLTGKVQVSLDQGRQVEARPANEVPPAFKRAVLAAEIVYQLHDNPRFGAVKQEKIIDLCERHLSLHDDIDRTSYRQAAGPYDNRAKRSIESNFKKQKWFNVVRQKGQGVKYVPLEKCGQHKSYFERYFGHCASEFQDLIDLLRDATTQQCEIVATLYAVWNDFLLEGKEPTDDEVVNEVLTNWHPEKQRIDEERWLKALDWMREKGLVPRGTGKHTEAVA